MHELHVPLIILLVPLGEIDCQSLLFYHCYLVQNLKM